MPSRLADPLCRATADREIEQAAAMQLRRVCCVNAESVALVTATELSCQAQALDEPASGHN